MNCERLEDRNLAGIEPLPTPRELKTALPVTPGAAARVVRARREIRDLLHGRDRRRLLVVVGPCSIHDLDAAREYALRLRRIAKGVRDRLLLVMRTYFEKPRTAFGWKGLIKDPRLDDSCDLALGLESARRILLEINELGVPCVSELLDPMTPQYIGDLLACAVIGARTSESQIHREMASGLSMPVGFKNPTDGNVEAAANAMVSARRSHTFFGVDVEGATSAVRTLGNPDVCLVLRGGVRGPNYSPEHVAEAAARVACEGIARPILVDCSHGNSGKDPARQASVCREVLGQVRSGQTALLGLMLESNLCAGRQDWAQEVELAYGVSITDACIGWEETEKLLFDAAETADTLRVA